MELPAPVRRQQAPLLILTNIIALSFKPGPLRILVTLPVFLIFAVQSLYNTEPGSYSDRYNLNVLVVCLFFQYLDWIVLANPDKERWHRVRRNRKEISQQEKKEREVPKTFLQRIWWGVCLATTTRNVGWSHQVKNVPVEVPSDYPKWRFIVRKALRFALMYVLSDAAAALTTSTPHGAWRGFENGKVTQGLDGLPLIHQYAMVWMYIVFPYTVMEMIGSLSGIIAVLLNLAAPIDCPSNFNDIKKMYMVRNCWSLVWHQNFRRIATAPAIFFARDVLHLRKGSFFSKYIQLFVAFFVTATTHAVGRMLTSKSLWEDAGWYATLMSQALAIFVEDHVIQLGKHFGFRESPFWQLVGYAWSIGWFCVSLRYTVSESLKSGCWIHPYTGDLFGLGAGM